VGLPITIATWDYDRVRPLIDGRVRVDGCDCRYLVLPPEECFKRAYIDREFEVSEIGLSPFLIALSRGLSDYVALPVFLSRMFRHSSIYRRNDCGIDTARDLVGKRVGVIEYQMSAVLWVRGMLWDDFGIRPDQIHWFQAGLNKPGRKEKFPLNVPVGFPLTVVGTGQTLSELLDRGELDALIVPQPPDCYATSAGRISRLWEDYEVEEKRYFVRTGIFPIMHALGIRKDIHAAHPWLAGNLYRAFEEAKAICLRDLFELSALKVSLPWVASQASQMVTIFGEDFWPYGLEKNRKTLEVMARYSFEQGLSITRLDVDSIFVDLLENSSCQS
jgi:4,5-dihydroxyphthalate decarboxylase